MSKRGWMGVAIFATTRVLADDSLPCNPTADPSEAFQTLSKVYAAIDKNQSAPAPGKGLDWWSASPDNVKNAPCMRQIPFSVEEMRKSIDQYAATSTDRVTRTINGVTFTEENPKLLDLFAKLTTYDHYDAEKHPERQKTFKSTCTKVQCAVNEIFGEKVGLQSLFALSRYGYNTSHLAISDADPWRSEELDSVLVGLSAYPPASLPIEENRPLAHFSRGHDDGRLIANAVIYLFDRWNKFDTDQERSSTVVHEVGHRFSMHYSNIDASKVWLEMSGWTTKTSIVDGKEKTEAAATKQQAIVSRYGDTNPGEDFAESIVAYRFNPVLLKEHSPEKYDFLRDTVFDGLEYFSKETCNRQSESSKLAVEVQAALANPNLTLPSESLERIGPRCGRKVFDTIKAATNTTPGNPASSAASHALDDCISQSLAQSQALGLAQSRTSAHPEFTLPILTETVGRLSPSVTAPVLAPARAATANTTRVRFIDLALNIDGNNALSYRQNDADAPTLKDWCSKTWSNLAFYAASSDARAAFEAVFNGPNDKYVVFDHQDLISNTFKQICVVAHQGEFPFKPLSREALDKMLAGFPDVLPNAIGDERIYGSEQAPKLDGLIARARVSCDHLYLTKKSDKYDSCLREAGIKSYLVTPPSWTTAFIKTRARAELEPIFVKAIATTDQVKKYRYGDGSSKRKSPEKFCADWPGYAGGTLRDAGMNDSRGFTGYFAHSHNEEFTQVLTELCMIAQKKMGKYRKPLSDAAIKETIASYFDSL